MVSPLETAGQPVSWLQPSARPQGAGIDPHKNLQITRHQCITLILFGILNKSAELGRNTSKPLESGAGKSYKICLSR
jgi:hypothetical protein